VSPQIGIIIVAMLSALAVTSCEAQRTPTGPAQARRLGTEARELYLKARYAEALPMYERAIQLDPSNIVAQRGIVWTRLALRQADLAVQNADVALARFPSDWMLLEARADALVVLGRTQDAILDYQRCIDLDPSGYWEPWMKLAATQKAVGSIADARATYRDLLSRYPGHIAAQQALKELERE
jgi:tetratricopeptide (TPR) repeat protein